MLVCILEFAEQQVAKKQIKLLTKLSTFVRSSQLVNDASLDLVLDRSRPVVSVIAIGENREHLSVPLELDLVSFVGSRGPCFEFSGHQFDQLGPRKRQKVDDLVDAAQKLVAPEM